MPAQIRSAISQHLLAPDAVRFVLNTDQPHQDYFDPSPEHPPEIIESLQLDLVEFCQDNAEAHRSVSLDPVADVSRNGQNQDHGAIGTAKSTIHQLSNSRDWFRSALKEKETRKWFEEAILDGDDIYLIVGYQSVLDARLSKERSASKGHGQNFKPQLP